MTIVAIDIYADGTAVAKSGAESVTVVHIRLMNVHRHLSTGTKMASCRPYPT